MTVNERQVPAYREVGTNEAGGKRRHWPEAVKRELVAATFEPGASVSLVARRHDVNTNLLFKWRRRFAAPKPMAAVASAGLVPVEIVPDPTSAPAAVTTAKPVTGTIPVASRSSRVVPRKRVSQPHPS